MCFKSRIHRFRSAACLDSLLYLKVASTRHKLHGPQLSMYRFQLATRPGGMRCSAEGRCAQCECHREAWKPCRYNFLPIQCNREAYTSIKITTAQAKTEAARTAVNRRNEKVCDPSDRNKVNKLSNEKICRNTLFEVDAPDMEDIVAFSSDGGKRAQCDAYIVWLWVLRGTNTFECMTASRRMRNEVLGPCARSEAARCARTAFPQ